MVFGGEDSDRVAVRYVDALALPVGGEGGGGEKEKHEATHQLTLVCYFPADLTISSYSASVTTFVISL